MTSLNGDLFRPSDDTGRSDRDDVRSPIKDQQPEALAADAAPATWEAEHGDLAASHTELSRQLGETIGEAAGAVRTESARCFAIRTTLQRARAALRGLGTDSEGLWFGVYLGLSALVIVAEVASGVATAWLITVPPAVRVLLMLAFIAFPPLTAIALGECLRPFRFRVPVGMQYRFGAALLATFAATYLALIYNLRAASVELTGEAPLLSGHLEASALSLIAAAGYLLAIVGAMTRESWRRFVISREVRRLEQALKMHGRQLARARIDAARAKVAADDDHPPNRGGPAAVAGIAIALAMLAAGVPRPATASPPASCPPSLAWIRTAEPPDSRLALLLTSNPGTDEQRALDRAMAKAVIVCAGARTAVALRAIDGNALTDPPVWQGVIPDDAPSADPYGAVRNAGFIAHAGAAIDHAMTAPFPGAPLQSDILGSLQAVGQDWSVAPRGGTRVAWVLSPGWLQSRYINVFRYKRSAAENVDQLVRRLRHDGTLPDLAGAHVYFVGLTPGAPGMGTTGAGISDLCSFWRAIVTAANGELTLCVGSLPGISRDTFETAR